MTKECSCDIRTWAGEFSMPIPGARLPSLQSRGHPGLVRALPETTLPLHAQSESAKRHG